MASNRQSRVALPVIVAVVFDLDGVIVDSEHVWDEAREALAHEHGARWHECAQRDMMGMSSIEWARYMRDVIGVPLTPERISDEVVRRMEAMYQERLPLIEGAVEAAVRLAKRWPLAVASSSNRPLIDLVLNSAGLTPYFRVTVSSEEVARGKPAPDVYLEAAARLDVEPSDCAAIEDSQKGLMSAKAAGMRVVAIPNRRYPPEAAAVSTADIVLESITDLTPDALEPLSEID